MTKILEYTAVNPLVVNYYDGTHNVTRGIPEGGCIGFNGDNVFCRNADLHWFRCLTLPSVFIAWLENGSVTKKPQYQLPEEVRTSETLKSKVLAFKKKQFDIETEKAAKAREPQKGQDEQGVHGGAGGIPEGSPLLPVLHPTVQT